MKFKAGDVVTIRGWEEMAEKFPCDENGNLDFKHTVFSKHMKKLCGKVAIVENVDEPFYKIRPMAVEDVGLDWEWNFTDDMLKG